VSLSRALGLLVEYSKFSGCGKYSVMIVIND